MSPCARYCLLIGSQLSTWSQGNLHYIRLRVTNLRVTLFSARSRIFLLSAQSCAALLCCRLGWLFGNYRSIATIKAGNFIYPMMHRLILYHHASERTWSYQFNRDATVEQHWKATCFADATLCIDLFTIFVLLFQIYLLLSQRECFGRQY